MDSILRPFFTMTRTLKQETTSKRVTSQSHPVHAQKNLVEWGEKEDESNLERSLPVELWTEILDHFPSIGPHTATFKGDQVLPEFYLVRIDILRALSQVCIHYRRIFLPLLWESLNVCFTLRKGNPGRSTDFYKHVGDALVRKCDGLSANPNLASYIGTVRLVITRHQSAVILPILTFLSSLKNLHTLQVLHAHPKMTTAIKDALQGLVFPKIHTLIIPDHFHEILRCCPQVTKVWCNCGKGGKLVTYIGKYCKEVQEMRGFFTKEKLVKRIIKAAPNLRDIEVYSSCRYFEPMLDALSSFTNINTIIIRAPRSDIILDGCIERAFQRLNDLAPSKERRHLRIWYKDNHQDYDEYKYYGATRITDINAHVRGFYIEVPLWGTGWTVVRSTYTEDKIETINTEGKMTGKQKRPNIRKPTLYMKED